MTSPVTDETLYAQYSETLARVLAEVTDFDPATLTPDTFFDHLNTASTHLARFHGSLADVADDIDTALAYLGDADEETDPGVRAVLMRKADKHLEALFFASDELVC